MSYLNSHANLSHNHGGVSFCNFRSLDFIKQLTAFHTFHDDKIASFSTVLIFIYVKDSYDLESKFQNLSWIKYFVRSFFISAAQRILPDISLGTIKHL